jgi:hypothetical protein
MGGGSGWRVRSVPSWSSGKEPRSGLEFVRQQCTILYSLCRTRLRLQLYLTVETHGIGLKIFCCPPGLPKVLIVGGCAGRRQASMRSYEVVLPVICVPHAKILGRGLGLDHGNHMESQLPLSHHDHPGQISSARAELAIIKRGEGSGNFQGVRRCL